MSEASKERCTQCENNCPVDALKCGKGRRFFGFEDARVFDPDSLIGMLKQCGHVLHHASSDINEAEMFQMLSEEEQATLKSLLQKVVAGWQNLGGGAHDRDEHGKRGKRSEHGEHSHK